MWRTKVPAKVNFNLYYRQQFKPLTLGIGINNIFNEKVYIVQPYKGGLAPIQAPERRLNFDIEFLF